MPNPWDVGTARMLAGLGYEALATTSAGLAFTLGRRDGEAAVSRDEALEHAAADRRRHRPARQRRPRERLRPRPRERRRDDPRRRGGRAGRLLDRGLDLRARRADLSARPGGRAHRGRRRGRRARCRSRSRSRPRRELPARPQRPRRHDRAPAGLRARPAPTCSMRRGCATSTTSARSARRSRSRSTCSRWPARRASRCSPRRACAASASARASFARRSAPSCARRGRCASTGRSAALRRIGDLADIAGFMQGDRPGLDPSRLRPGSVPVEAARPVRRRAAQPVAARGVAPWRIAASVTPAPPRRVVAVPPTARGPRAPRPASGSASQAELAVGASSGTSEWDASKRVSSAGSSAIARDRPDRTPTTRRACRHRADSRSDQSPSDFADERTLADRQRVGKVLAAQPAMRSGRVLLGLLVVESTLAPVGHDHSEHRRDGNAEKRSNDLVLDAGGAGSVFPSNGTPTRS